MKQKKVFALRSFMVLLHYCIALQFGYTQKGIPFFYTLPMEIDYSMFNREALLANGFHRVKVTSDLYYTDSAKISHFSEYELILDRWAYPVSEAYNEFDESYIDQYEIRNDTVFVYRTHARDTLEAFITKIMVDNILFRRHQRTDTLWSAIMYDSERRKMLSRYYYYPCNVDATVLDKFWFTWKYDDAGRIVEYWRYPASDLSKESCARRRSYFGLRLVYKYDEQGNLKKILQCDPSSIQYRECTTAYEVLTYKTGSDQSVVITFKDATGQRHTFFRHWASTVMYESCGDTYQSVEYLDSTLTLPKKIMITFENSRIDVYRFDYFVE